jgi:hypothetical protein
LLQSKAAEIGRAAGGLCFPGRLGGKPAWLFHDKVEAVGSGDRTPPPTCTNCSTYPV